VRSGDFLIGYFLGPIPLGYYSLGYNLLTVMIDLLVSVPNLVIFPIFSKIQGEPERLKSAFYEVIQLQSIIAFPIFLGIFIVAPEAIRVLYSDIWIASIPIAQLLMLTGIVRSAILIYSSIFRAAGKPSWRFYIYISPDDSKIDQCIHTVSSEPIRPFIGKLSDHDRCCTRAQISCRPEFFSINTPDNLYGHWSWGLLIIASPDSPRNVHKNARTC
jgi:hypothetical protein